MVVVSRFIVHHAARDCASISRRAILDCSLFHNAVITERIMKVIRYLSRYIYNNDTNVRFIKEIYFRELFLSNKNPNNHNH